MKIVVIGGTGLIGSKLVALLRQRGQEVLAASPDSGVNTLTGEGLSQALAGAQVVVDVANSPSFEDTAVMKFFQTAGRNLLAAEAAAGVGHHIALSIVGADRLPDSGYMRAKVVQEKTIMGSGLPYSVVRATQFHEFAVGIVGSLEADDEVRAPDALIQPIAADDVVAEVARVAVGSPINGVVNIGGPDKISFSDLARSVLAKQGADKPVVVDPQARYFGTPVHQNSLVTADGAALGNVRFADWLASH